MAAYLIKHQDVVRRVGQGGAVIEVGDDQMIRVIKVGVVQIGAHLEHRVNLRTDSGQAVSGRETVRQVLFHMVVMVVAWRAHLEHRVSVKKTAGRRHTPEGSSQIRAAVYQHPQQAWWVHLPWAAIVQAGSHLEQVVHVDHSPQRP